MGGEDFSKGAFDGGILSLAPTVSHAEGLLMENTSPQTHTVPHNVNGSNCENVNMFVSEGLYYQRRTPLGEQYPTKAPVLTSNLLRSKLDFFFSAGRSRPRDCAKAHDKGVRVSAHSKHSAGAPSDGDGGYRQVCGARDRKLNL